MEFADNSQFNPLKKLRNAVEEVAAMLDARNASGVSGSDHARYAELKNDLREAMQHGGAERIDKLTWTIYWHLFFVVRAA